MDGMTIEEAIKHCEEVADTCEYEASKYDMTDAYERSVACKEGECASEHRQLAEWLRELKKWRALRDSINMLCVVDCEYPMYRESKTMCDACPIGTVKEYFEEIFGEDINADEEVGDSE